MFALVEQSLILSSFLLTVEVTNGPAGSSTALFLFSPQIPAHRSMILSSPPAWPEDFGIFPMIC